MQYFVPIASYGEHVGGRGEERRRALAAKLYLSGMACPHFEKTRVAVRSAQYDGDALRDAGDRRPTTRMSSRLFARWGWATMKGVGRAQVDGP